MQEVASKALTLDDLSGALSAYYQSSSEPVVLDNSKRVVRGGGGGGSESREINEVFRDSRKFFEGFTFHVKPVQDGMIIMP